MIEPIKVHITGVYGLIGNLVYKHLGQWPERYELYGSGRRQASSRRADEDVRVEMPDEHFSIADVSDAHAVDRALEGMDAVLHIAAVPGPEDSFDDVMESNIRGTYNVLEACHKKGVGRMVYASSIMATWGYCQFVEPYKSIGDNRADDIPDDFPLVKHTDPVRPTEPYSTSKVWAEGACRTYADAHGLSVICLRIGRVMEEDQPQESRHWAVWCSRRDLAGLVRCCIEAPDELRFEIFYALSDNRWGFRDIERARELIGYQPQDRAEDHR